MNRKILLLIFVMLLSLMTGCWNRRELSELAIVLAVGIDKKKDGYHLSTQIVNPGELTEKASPIGYTPVVTWETSAKTLFECFRKMTKISPRKLYLSHVRVLVISEEIAKEGLKNVLDFFMRDHEFRPDFFVVISRGSKAKDILSTFSQLDKIPANKLFFSLQTSEENWAPTLGVHLDELIANIVIPGINPVLTGLEITGDKSMGKIKESIQTLHKPAQLQFTSLGVLKKDKLIGWLDEAESKGYNYIMNKVKSTVGYVDIPEGGKVVVEITRSKAKMTGKMKNGQPEVEVDIMVEGNIGEVEGSIDLTKAKSIYQLEVLSEQKIKKMCEAAINKAQKKMKSDIFGFGGAIHRTDPKAWKTLQRNWDETFVNVPVKVKIDAKLRRTGKVSSSFIEEMKKK